MVATEMHFLTAKSQNRKASKLEIKDGFNDPRETEARFTCQPEVLRHPVRDVAGRCWEIGITTMGTPRPLQCLLAELSGLPVIRYRIHLVAWMKCYSGSLQFAHKWCGARAFNFMEYYDHLGRGGPADGLEVMLVSLALDTHINVVFDDSVWATGKEGPDFQYPTIVWTNAGALPCKVQDPDSGNLADIDTSHAESTSTEEERVPASLTNRVGGCPLISIREVDFNSQNSVN